MSWYQSSGSSPPAHDPATCDICSYIDDTPHTGPGCAYDLTTEELRAYYGEEYEALP